MLGLAVAPALVFGTGMFFLPETPRWLIRGGHHEVARRVLVRIRSFLISTSRSKRSRRAWRGKLRADTGPICSAGKCAHLSLLVQVLPSSSKLPASTR